MELSESVKVINPKDGRYYEIKLAPAEVQALLSIGLNVAIQEGLLQLMPAVNMPDTPKDKLQ